MALPLLPYRRQLHNPLTFELVLSDEVVQQVDEVVQQPGQVPLLEQVPEALLEPLLKHNQ